MVGSSSISSLEARDSPLDKKVMMRGGDLGVRGVFLNEGIKMHWISSSVHLLMKSKNN